MKLKLILILALVFLGTIACTEDEKLINISEDLTLFDQVIQEEKSYLNEFSDNLNGLNFIEGIKITASSSNQIKFSLSVSSKVLLNRKEVDLSEREYTIRRVKGQYLIKDNKLDLPVKIDVFNEVKVKINNNDFSTFDDLNGEEIYDDLERNFPLYAFLLHEFTTEGLVRRVSSERRGMAAAGWCREAVGVGFHWNRSDADYFCKEDYDEILSDHPEWMSTGISTSCVTDAHYCVCTAYFYVEC